ncbi:hypothetical protein H2198_003710 [Neophaeococcomyces mojaviensis]|uniref:Uncharacterized protein n=1 Tax=Neophaeococcomyces mojaviensis TaxID=3383035 RepID=A0ACC3AAZ6_9EURO|nr:hypothetical protein H2198_003710 [Knufia sp. JES_112]
MSIGGTVLRFGGLLLRLLQFCCSGLALGIFSYFLSVLADHDLSISRRWQAVEGITGAATLYTIFAIILTLCLGGNAFFGFLAVFLDLCFIGGFIAVAWFTRHGANSCTGVVQTPLGSGQSNSNAPGYGANGFGFGSNQNSTYFPNLHLACRLNTVVFAVSIIAIFLFLLTAIWQVLMVRHHKKEKKYGPSPANNYTSGSGRKPFWKKKQRRTKDVETAGTLGAGAHTVRPSHETGTTIGNNAYVPEPKYGEPAYGHTGHHHHQNTGTYHDRTTF